MMLRRTVAEPLPPPGRRKRMTASDHAATFYDAQIKERIVTPTKVDDESRGPALELAAPE
jgi:hypothetical protein